MLCGGLWGGQVLDCVMLWHIWLGTRGSFDLGLWYVWLWCVKVSVCAGYLQCVNLCVCVGCQHKMCRCGEWLWCVWCGV